ncbi:hypothetical protein VTP01DRAFT_8337 [Rhizomucor pusillus]|uniref:uncharacterized protein n=1 Tax=Rhizomucor pusillus TaxID=4840 RepID=UPI003743B7A0
MLNSLTLYVVIYFQYKLKLRQFTFTHQYLCNSYALYRSCFQFCHAKSQNTAFDKIETVHDLLQHSCSMLGRFE